jgi:hypothetical protein
VPRGIENSRYSQTTAMSYCAHADCDHESTHRFFDRRSPQTRPRMSWQVPETGGWAF